MKKPFSKTRHLFRGVTVMVQAQEVYKGSSSRREKLGKKPYRVKVRVRVRLAKSNGISALLQIPNVEIFSFDRVMPLKNSLVIAL